MLLLWNDPTLKSKDPLLQQELIASQGKATRRWGNDSAMISREGCYVACQNNYVWIDTRTGRFPRGKSVEGLACIRCSFFQTQANEPLYSVWNSKGGISPSGLKVDSALWDMQGFAGACYACPANTDTIAGDDNM